MKREELGARLAILLEGILMGTFLAVRLEAFLVQARELSVPLPVLLMLAPLLGVLGAVFYPQVRAYLDRFAWGKSRWRLVFYALCVLLCFRFRGLVLDSAIEGGGVALTSLLSTFALAGAGLLLGLFLLHLLYALRECLAGAGAWFRGLTGRDYCAILLLFALTELAVWAYATGSRTIYSWDSAIYWRSTYSLAETFRDQGFLAGMKSVYDSIFVSDYNYTIGLLCVPFALLFGPSRTVYLMSIGTFCLFPTLLLMWGYARSLKKPGFGLALAGILALPSLFYTSVTGYVDIAGAAVAMAALMLTVKEEEKGRFTRFLLIGVLAAVSVLLRRWYAFFALAFLLCLIVTRRSPIPALGYLCGFAFPLLFFFQTFVSKRLLADYASMYVAYDLGLGVDFRILFRYYGIFLLAAALALAVWLIRTRTEDRRNALLLLLEPILCFFLFTRVQSHGQQHLLLYVPALALLLLLGFARLGEEKGRLGWLLVALAVVPTAVSPALPREQSGIIQDYPLFIPFPNFSYAPPVREDAEDVVALVRRLDEFGAEGKQVGLLSSSFVLNTSTLRNAEDSLGLARVSDVDRSYLRDLPAVDQRDGFSPALYECDVLAVADPIQLHLGEGNQQVVWAPAWSLLNGENIAGAYEKLEESFQLGDLTVYFFEKRREPTAEEKAGLAELIHKTHPEMVIWG